MALGSFRRCRHPIWGRGEPFFKVLKVHLGTKNCLSLFMSLDTCSNFVQFQAMEEVTPSLYREKLRPGACAHGVSKRERRTRPQWRVWNL